MKQMKENKGKKWDFFRLKKKEQTQFFFSIFFNHKGVPPLAQGNGWGNTSPWHMQHNKPIAKMQ